jgi:hypothetical protein
MSVSTYNDTMPEGIIPSRVHGATMMEPSRSMQSSMIGDSLLGDSMIDTEGGDASVKFKMMMIGDLSAGKSDMMAKYFGRGPHEIFMALTEGGIIKEHKSIMCCNKVVKIDCLDTT